MINLKTQKLCHHHYICRRSRRRHLLRSDAVTHMLCVMSTDLGDRDREFNLDMMSTVR